MQGAFSLRIYTRCLTGLIVLAMNKVGATAINKRRTPGCLQRAPSAFKQKRCGKEAAGQAIFIFLHAKLPRKSLKSCFCKGSLADVLPRIASTTRQQASLPALQPSASSLALLRTPTTPLAAQRDLRSVSSGALLLGYD